MLKFKDQKEDADDNPLDRPFGTKASIKDGGWIW